MDYAVGDKLSLLIAAINPDKQDQVLFPIGTVATVEYFEKELVNLRFPDGILYAHNVKDVAVIFKHVSQGKVLAHTLTGLGTPPHDLFSFLPKGADWKKNYLWKVIISLEEKTEKKIICQDCTTEITDMAKTDEHGDIYCTGCKEYIVPFDLLNNKPFFTDTNVVSHVNL